MNGVVAAGLAAFLLLARGAWAADPASATPTPLAAYGGLPSISDVEISPGGTRLALIAREGAENQLQVRNVSDGSPVLATSIGKAKVRGLVWAGEHHLLIRSSTTRSLSNFYGDKEEYSQLSDLDIDHKRLHSLLGDIQSGMSLALSSPIVLHDGDVPKVIVAAPHWEIGYGGMGLYGVDLKTDQSHFITMGSSYTNDFVTDSNGQTIAREDYDGRTGVWQLYLRDGWAWKLNRQVIAPLDPPDLDGLGRDDGSVFVYQHDKGADVVREIELKTGEWSAPIPQLQDADAIRDPASKIVIGASRQGLDKTIYDFFSPADQKAWSAITAAFPGEQVELQSWSDDRKEVVVSVDGQTHGDAYYLVDLKIHSAYWIADEYASIGPKAIAERRAIHYAASDGLDIPAYLTLPQGKVAKSLPLIVLVHGGPEARDEPGFDWWAQAVASRGYAVLQPQYRGSDGLGPALHEAGYGQWGHKMQTDVSDGVRTLVQQGLVDGSRVCIIGASFGGYAALAGVTFEPSTYRCAVSLAGPSDMRKQLLFEEDRGVGGRSGFMRDWERLTGAKSPEDRSLDDISPALHADKVTAPILLMHGEDDTVVPYQQSQEMENALKRAGKSVAFVTLKSEDHWLSRSETRQQMLEAALDFLEQHNPPGSAPVTSAAL